MNQYSYEDFGNTRVYTLITLEDKSQCKNEGWMHWFNSMFKNQGECVSYLQSNINAGKR